MDCPDNDTIYSYILEEITGEKKKNIQKHIEKCHICQIKLLELREDIEKIEIFLKHYTWDILNNNGNDSSSELYKKEEDKKDINHLNRAVPSAYAGKTQTWKILKNQIMSIYFLLWKNIFFRYSIRKKLIFAFTAIMIILFIPVVLTVFTGEKATYVKYSIEAKIYPADPVAVYNLGLMTRAKNPQEARKLIERAYLLDHNYAVSYYDFGKNSIPELQKIVILSNCHNDYITRGMSFSVKDKLSLVKTLSPVSGDLWDEINNRKNLEHACKTAARLGGKYLLFLNNLYLNNNQWNLDYSLIEIVGEKVIASGILVSPSIVQLQINLVVEVARTITGNLTEMEEKILKKPPCNPETFKLYLEGKGHYYRYVEENNRTAIKLFKKAITLDPDFAPAYAALADSLTQQYGLFNDRKEHLIKEAIEYANKALSIDPSLAEGYKSLGLSFSYLGKRDEGIKEYEKALLLNENYTEVYINLAMVFLNEKNFDKAFTMLQKAIKTNSFSSEAHKELASYYLIKRNYKKAIKEYETAIEAGFLNRHSLFQSYSNIALCYKLQGEHEKAIIFLEKALSVNSEKGITCFELGEIFNSSGKEEKAIKYYRDYLKLEPAGKFSSRVKTILKLLENKKGKIEGLVTNRSGENPAGLKVIYRKKPSVEEEFVSVTDKRGFYTITLPAGNYVCSEIRKNKKSINLKKIYEVKVMPGHIQNMDLYIN
ncbi:MAG: tetratricopeptide repeat protein [Candidatus Eremiobacterota bacterium]